MSCKTLWDAEIKASLKAALDLLPATGLRCWTCHYPFRLIAVTGMRLSKAIRLEQMPMSFLVPLEITPMPDSISSEAPALFPGCVARKGWKIEIELGGGCRVHVDSDVDVERSSEF